MDYKKYELKEKRGIRWVNLDKNKALTGIQMRYKATTTNEQSAFKGYVNSYAITNVRVRGIKALQYLKYQDLRLKEYLMKHKGMKVILQVSATMKSKKTNEEIRESIRSRRYNITNEEEIPQKLNQMSTGIEFQLDKMEMSESGLLLKHIDKLKSTMTNTIQLVEVHTLNYLNGWNWKRACINIQTQDDKCFMYSIQCGVCKVYEKDHPNRIYRYKNLKDDLNWDNVNFPASNLDIDILEQNNEGKISINVYYIDD